LEPEFKKDMEAIAPASLLQIDGKSTSTAFLAEEARKNRAFRAHEAAKNRASERHLAHMRAATEALAAKTAKTFESLKDGDAKQELDRVVAEVSSHADDFAKDADSWKAKLEALKQQPSSFVEEGHPHHHRSHDRNPFLTPSLEKLEKKVHHELAHERKLGKEAKQRIRQEDRHFHNIIKDMKSDGFNHESLLQVKGDDDLDFSQGATETGAPISYDDELRGLESGLSSSTQSATAQMDDAVRGLEPNPFASQLGVAGDETFNAGQTDTQTSATIDPEIAAFDSGLGSADAFDSNADVPLEPESYLQEQDNLRKH